MNIFAKYGNTGVPPVFVLGTCASCLKYMDPILEIPVCTQVLVHLQTSDNGAESLPKID